MKTVLLILGCVLMAHGVRAEISCPTAVAHRRTAASAISNPILFEEAVADGLKDRDPMIRRYALVPLNAMFSFSISTFSLSKVEKGAGRQ